MPLTMTIDLKQIKLCDLFDGYQNDEENGVVGYHGRLDIRPKYQREFIPVANIIIPMGIFLCF